MAQPGQPVSQQYAVPAAPSDVIRRLTGILPPFSGGHFDGSIVTTDGAQTIWITRRFVPTWAIVVAVIGFFCALLGLLALLYRDTESCVIQIQPASGGGSQVVIQGMVDQNVLAQISAALANPF